MPKRRMTPERRAQIRLWQAASHGRARSWSNPIPARKVLQGKLGTPATVPGSFGHTRRHKQGGKAYQKKSAGSVHIAKEARDIMSGKATFRDQAMVDLGHAGPAKVPRIKSSWRTKTPSAQAVRARQVQANAHKAKKAIQPSKVHGSGTGLQAWARYKKGK